ncbi:uncharacterized protein LOC117111149 [Anneissia japonica]|uniref:uncharacterized protein LOC117111149 n=1 Tax=Anneissia japonica TaxID=1529436 RepID=UPI0014255652|nr:uncharacterized protein LOC117111149 [Anneissia japonica]
MDVERGCCWRCEINKAKKKCTHCNIAEYCGTICLDRDKIRHQVECDMWNRNKECARCKKKLKCSLCSACKEITYCSRECQLKHWPTHKAECKQIRQQVKTLAESHRFHLQNFNKMHSIDGFPYFFGNTLAIDVLKLGLNEAEPSLKNVASQLARDYNILFAGVGDLRNLLLTTASLPNNFTGNIRFTLNDIDPFVLARGVLFLYMMITRSSRKYIEASITNIWYSIQLPDEDFHLLMSALNELIEHTVETLKGRTNNLLDVEDKDFEMMKEVWGKWREMECETGKHNSIHLSAQRSSMFDRDPGSSDGISTYIHMIPKEYRVSAKEYFEKGLFLPKYVLKRRELKYDNPTLTGRPRLADKGMHVPTRPKCYNFVYCIRADILPFNGWDYIQAKSVSQPNSIVDLFHTYIASIIKSALIFFGRNMIYSKLILKNCTDLFKLSNAKPEFDRIMTSNIADFTNIKVLLSSMRPLLSTTNKHAVLVTELLNWTCTCPEADLGNPQNSFKVHHLGLSDKMVKDTGRRELANILQGMKDYYDDTTLFTRYLRILFLAITDKPSVKEEVPFFLKAFDNIEGFRLRDFTKELNKVMPFRYRLNTRPCNQCTGFERNLEWQLV